jgi:hypothetical protein
LKYRPDTHHISDTEQDEDEQLQFVAKETLEVLEVSEKVANHMLNGLGVVLGNDVDFVRRFRRVNLCKVLERESRRWLPVELCDPVENLDSLCLSSASQEVFRRLVEVEDEESEEEDEERHATEDDEEISPTHVARDRTAWCAAGDSDT